MIQEAIDESRDADDVPDAEIELNDSSDDEAYDLLAQDEDPMYELAEERNQQLEAMSL